MEMITSSVHLVEYRVFLTRAPRVGFPGCSKSSIQDIDNFVVLISVGNRSYIIFYISSKLKEKNHLTLKQEMGIGKGVNRA